MTNIDVTDDYEFLILPKKPKECRVFRRYHPEKSIGTIFIRRDESYGNLSQLPTSIVKKALEYLGYEDKDMENA